DAFRAQTGKDGTGITVGVISDSVNRVGGGLADSQATGDLPAGNVLKDGNARDPAEGRAMPAGVPRLAPGARLRLATADRGPAAAAGVGGRLAPISGGLGEDFQSPDEPFFNDGLLARAVDQAAIGSGVTYVTAAGNNGSKGWQAQFHAAGASVGGQDGTFAAVNPQDPNQVLQHFHLAPGQTLDLGLQWDAAFLEGGSPRPQ